MNTLQTTFDFDVTDLEANQFGKITPRQQNRLWTKYRQRMPIYLFSMAITLIGVITVFLNGQGANVPVVLLIFTGMQVFLIGMWHADWANVRQEIEHGKVAVARGIVHQMATSRALLIDVNRLTFPVSNHEAAAFESGKRYCIYYAPLSQTILSVKQLG